MSGIENFGHRLHQEERHLLTKFRQFRDKRLRPPTGDSALGDRVADAVAATVGSWTFIILQSIILFVWMALNVTAYVEKWDPYPFILLNLVLSFQAAYSAPIIMMSQNRQAKLDRLDAKGDYEINLKAELEIELLHEKIDLMRESELLELVNLVKRIEARLPPIAIA